MAEFEVRSEIAGMVRSIEAGAMALIDVDQPVRKPGEVLIKISAGGICGTDVAIWKWHEAVVGQYAPSFPLIVDGGATVGVYFGTTSGEVWASADEGGTWRRIAEHLPEIYSLEWA